MLNIYKNNNFASEQNFYYKTMKINTQNKIVTLKINSSPNA